MKHVLTVNASSTIMLLMAIEAMYPVMRFIHVFRDNARYHHAKLAKAWLARPQCRIKLHFIPAYCPHPWSPSRPNPIERLWGLVHRLTSHNKCYATFKDFSIAMLAFLRDDVPENWRTYCDKVTGRLRVTDPMEFQTITCARVMRSATFCGRTVW
jgi:DDE superfamily endonuclease